MVMQLHGLNSRVQRLSKCHACVFVPTELKQQSSLCSHSTDAFCFDKFPLNAPTLKRSRQGQRGTASRHRFTSNINQNLVEALNGGRGAAKRAGSRVTIS